MHEWMKLDDTYVAHTYARFPVELVSGEGSVFLGADGKHYIDLGSGIGVTAFGTGDPVWKQAVVDQLNRLQHTSNLYYTEPCVRLAQLLCEKTGMKKVFFGNSGAEANECAIKVARKYAAEKKGAAYSTIVTLENSFHGRTLTTLAATGQEHYHELYQPLTPGFVHAKANDPEDLRAKVLQQPTAAIMVECIQGEGGVIPMTKEFLQSAEALARELDIPLIVDEVQTGNGRTGTLYAYMQYGIQPDIVSTAKGLGGGLPIGACLLGQRVQDVLTPGDHGSTYGGNPVCCAGAVSVQERLDDAFLSEVQRKGQLIRDTLTGAPGVEQITGLGMMVGIKTAKPAKNVVLACMEKGVLCLTAKDRVRLLPALNIPEETLLEALEILKQACAENN